jgi:3-phosphoshikimate 1-carboxyvinyltransferase
MIRLSHKTKKVSGNIKLPSSKSISNRMLILQKLYEPSLVIENLSNANDTKVLQTLLASEDKELNVEDAGTAFRFLVAYCAVTKGERIIRGTQRLEERPIKELVDVLNGLGAKISYLEKEGYAPLKIEGATLKADGLIDLMSVKSSQFISALLMIMPLIKGDVEIKINRKMNSFSYVVLTINAMRRLGFSIMSRGAYLTVSKKQNFKGEYFLVEPDWTSFYYWYAIAHLAEKANLLFPGINQSNMHKDRKRLFDIGNKQIRFEDTSSGFYIQKDQPNTQIECANRLNFAQYPDLAPTFSFLMAALNCDTCNYLGLESLKYKESNREVAINLLLQKMNYALENNGVSWCLKGDFKLKDNTLFETFDDHRMAMSVAPLALLAPIIIEDENVVSKSYPHFWEDLESVGFEIEYL